MFHIGDNVRFRDDSSNEIWSILNIYTSINKVQVFSKKLNTAKVVDPLSLVPSGLYELKQAIREVLLSDEFLSAFAKAFANTPIPSTIQSVSDLSKGLVKAWTCENGKAKQVYPEPKWTPKVGDWVKIKKPADSQTSATSWWPSMDKYDGQIIQVKQIEEDGVVLGEWGFMFDWLEPAEPQKEQPQPLDGWRWLEVGEVIRKGDRGFESGRVYAIEPMKIGMRLQAHWMPTIRRNRFEVGEKVVLKDSDVAWEVEKIIEGRLYKIKKLPAEYSTFAIGNKLAPYIEETT